jgi:hypothetical protein
MNRWVSRSGDQVDLRPSLRATCTRSRDAWVNSVLAFMRWGSGDGGQLYRRGCNVVVRGTLTMSSGPELEVSMKPS